jgi:tetratricopeptide (TPR) repeat protein
LDKDGRNLELYTRSADLGLESVHVFERLGWYYHETGDKAKAVEMYEKVIAIDPTVKQWNTRQTARTLAKLYQALENYKRAAELYEKSLISNKNVEDLYGLALCYERLGKLDEALAKLNEAVGMPGGYANEEIVDLRSDIYSRKVMLEKAEFKTTEVTS